MGIYNLISLIGVFILMFVAWFFSKDHTKINWRVIFWGILFQMLVAIVIFWLPVGVFVFRWLNTAVIRMLSFAKEGIYFLLGPLSISPGEAGPAGEKSLGFILAFQALPTIVFFSALMAFLYYIRIMPLIIRGFAIVFTKLMDVSGAEALCASSNIFVGVESAFTIRPYIEKMTRSELCTILTAGMATIASSVLALYVSFLQKEFPMIAGHLISASLMSAPAAIIMSKLLYPERDEPATLCKVVREEPMPQANWIEAIINGSFEGVKLCVGVVALLLTFLGFLAMVNWTLGKLIGISLQDILWFIFYPFTFITGVPIGDVSAVSKLLGERAIVTELVAYQHLDALIKSGSVQNLRSIVLATYSLCGFSHIASLAIFVGGIATLAPSRIKDLSQLGFRALFAATLACLMTAAIAGIFFVGQKTILFK